jgi:Zinc finger C-x8-C-x5-C-x3-H type (and similar)
MLLADSICYSNQFQQEAKKIRKAYNESNYNIKYKTEICKNWLSGQCKFGEFCIFAHGTEEIKSNAPQKLQECKNFKNNHWCSYGDKCQFKHIHTSKLRLPIFASILLRSTIEP